MGDKSDNIPSAFPKCGPKTALKCAEDPEFFKKKMDNKIGKNERCNVLLAFYNLTFF